MDKEAVRHSGRGIPPDEWIYWGNADGDEHSRSQEPVGWV
jgi:hypothetical protein